VKITALQNMTLAAEWCQCVCLARLNSRLSSVEQVALELRVSLESINSGGQLVCLWLFSAVCQPTKSRQS